MKQIIKRTISSLKEVYQKIKNTITTVNRYKLKTVSVFLCRKTSSKIYFINRTMEENISENIIFRKLELPVFGSIFRKKNFQAFCMTNYEQRMLIINSQISAM